MYSAEDYKSYKQGSEELVAKLVEEHMGWAQAIARSVARAWNLDWQIDGLDGGAYEGLVFCAGRYDPSTGVPFRGYARRRIHEAATEEARKSKGWKQSASSSGGADAESRDISARLFDIYPEMREGLLPTSKNAADEGLRMAIRQMLTSASMIAAFQESATNPENQIEYRKMLTVMAELEKVHQSIIWLMYWQGQSMRSIATDWEVDELTVIREHKEIVRYLLGRLSKSNSRSKRLKIRPGLRPVAQRLRKTRDAAPFEQFLGSLVILLCSLLEVFGQVAHI